MKVVGWAILTVAMLAAGMTAYRTGLTAESAAALGLPGVFLATAVSSATIVFAMPILPLVAAAGATWGVLPVALVAATGSTAGELVGYAVGVGGASRSATAGPVWWQTFRSWLDQWGFPVLVVVAALPNPAFDAAGVVAGVQRYPLVRFGAATFLGKFIKCFVAAGLGQALATWWAQ